MAPPRAYIFIGLNAARALSIIALLLLFASSIVTLVQDIKAVNAFIAAGKADPVSSDNSTDVIDCSELEYIPNSTVPNQPAGAFWAVLNRLLIIFQVIVLILSEIGWPAKFFNRYFPVLGDEFGLGALGVIQCLLGAAVLSHHVDEFSLVSAFFLFAIGCLNILLGLIFRESAKARRALTSWREADVLPRSSAHGTLSRSYSTRTQSYASPRSGPRPLLTAMSTGGSGASWDRWEKFDKEGAGAETARSMSQRSGMGFGRQGEKAALMRGATLTRPAEALPTYIPRPTAGSPAPTYASRPSKPTVTFEEREARHTSVVSYASEEESATAV
ncbi:hypothetical protein AcW1_002267 [Taiwanofungus camphoratus]|nr:hypothetical protein AcV5_010268 [Antrodia cinnamomea]KAI0944596.1 hypothetical protein AcW1_002267 [Antrodia cinnamomea]KAI0946245.1 hypothetical protein AcV7_010274 [Antrodia cinnamomea]